MESQLTWLIAGRVLYAARSGQESLEALASFTQQVIQHLENAGPPPVHIIWNMSGLIVDGVDRQQAIPFLNRIMQHHDVKWFVVVDVGMKPFRRLMASTILRLIGVRWRTVDSREDALAFLRRVDASLSKN